MGESDGAMVSFPTNETQALDSNPLTQFTVESSLQEIFSRIMVDQWVWHGFIVFIMKVANRKRVFIVSVPDFRVGCSKENIDK